MNIWERLKKESGKSTYDISKEINVPEETVKEIINGEREVPTERVDEVYNAFKTKNTNKTSSIERALMEKFFMDNDIQDLKEKWGYKNLEELSEAIKISRSQLYELRGEKVKTASNNLLKKVYEFFQDGFNKKIAKNDKIKYNKLVKISREELPKEVLDWYYNTDLKKLRKKKNLTAEQMLKKIGFNKSYLTVYYKAENKKLEDSKAKFGNYVIIQQLYNYYNGLELLNIYKGNSIKEKVKNEKQNNENIVNDVIDNTDIINNNDNDKNINEEITTKRCLCENAEETNECDIPSEYTTIRTKDLDKLISQIERYEYLIDLLRKNGV